MGFDLSIQVRFFICENTGKLYYYGRKNFDRMYGVPELNIPEEWWIYIKHRGRIFRAYIDAFEEQNNMSPDITDFEENFPTWEYIKESVEYENGWADEWTENDHNEYKKMVQWLAKQDIPYFVSWC